MGIEGSFVKTLFGLGLALLVGVVIIGGIRRIGQITEKLVPFMGIVYLLGSLAVVTVHYQYIGEAIGLIVGQAFSPAAGLGGMVGVLITGFRRACFSNEAGIGSAAIAHSAVKTRYPASEGLVALWEPFVDTVVICTLTALTIIFFSEGVFTYGIQDQWGKVVVGDGGQVVGTASTLDSVFKFSDAMILAMAFPNMIGLFLLAPKARKELGRYLDAIGLRKKE
ncbi:alanine or glycine:cation symporter, AGCS family [Parapedobacter indicus]|uniref:Alanine or glycine:cation symporter, AGCS family n=2 Tax=Parapedobacter indicus TaxID=1477437 RepID=A0A1I3DQ72_9SPHI|nr:sodium:alanine symporter family protein [Parapedobacter indicus]SFH88872.1 alanine or glycine:cation symporter, AGCS family [Parapedobacter indicus]